MATHQAAWPSAATRFLAVRLSPGDDLRDALERAFAEVPERAGFVVAALGSLSWARRRYAGRDAASKREGGFELTSLSGTLSVDGPHLHATVSDPDGVVTGGHLMPGCVVRTTAEVVIGLAEDVSFRRPLDPQTGYAELAFEA